jgi:hypothetical protein
MPVDSATTKTDLMRILHLGKMMSDEKYSLIKLVFRNKLDGGESFQLQPEGG